MAVGPRARLEAPPSAPGRHGLIASAVEVPPGDERWVNGFGFDPESCDPAALVAIGCAPGGDAKPVAGLPPLVEYEPFMVIGSDRCAMFDQGRDRDGRARRHLLATESHQLEAEFWDGALARAEPLPNLYLAKTGADALGSGGPVAALARLEQALGECLHGQRGMIHATLTTVSFWMAAGVLRVEGGLLLTALDTIVVAGSGYSGSAPGAAPVPPADLAAAATAYGTGLVYVRRGAIFAPDDASRASRVDRTVNTETTYVERPIAAVTSGCCRVSVTVTHSAP